LTKKEFVTEEDYSVLFQIYDAGELKDKERYVLSGRILSYLLGQVVRAM
jgi:hypothetical protein